MMQQQMHKVQNLDPQLFKVDINSGFVYQSTSFKDVLQHRIEVKEKQKQLNFNRFLQLKDKEEQDPDFADEQPQATQFKPFQCKVQYNAQEESSELESEELDSFKLEDKQVAQAQPYETVTQVSYKDVLKSLPFEELCRRSDVMITSTLSLSIFPKDQRFINNYVVQTMAQPDIDHYIDEKKAFNAYKQQHRDETQRMREKDNMFRDTYLRSFMHRNKFKSQTMQKFKQEVKQYNQNYAIVPIKDKKVLVAEKLRHEQNKRMATQRGMPKFDKDSINILLEGKFHEQFEADTKDAAFLNKSMYASELEDLRFQAKVDEFEK